MFFLILCASESYFSFFNLLVVTPLPASPQQGREEPRWTDMTRMGAVGLFYNPLEEAGGIVIGKDYFEANSLGFHW